MRKLKRYVVGCDGDERTVYGCKNMFGGNQWADPLTLKEAQRLLRSMPDSVIYKLVPVRSPRKKGK
jgi:hypothetical protein